LDSKASALAIINWSPKLKLWQLESKAEALAIGVSKARESRSASHRQVTGTLMFPSKANINSNPAIV